MTELVLVRHCETPWNQSGRYQGHVDVDLAPEGEARARELRARLDALRLTPPQLWSSDLLRARRTAMLVFPDARIRTDPRLRELAFGVFEGHTHEENRRVHAEAFSRWRRDPVGSAPPGGESLAALEARLFAWLRERAGESLVVACTHAGPIHTLVASTTGRAHAASRERWLDPGAVVRVRWRPGVTPLAPRREGAGDPPAVEVLEEDGWAPW